MRIIRVMDSDEYSNYLWMKFVLGLIMFIFALYILIIALSVICIGKIFRKMGYKWWYALIPGYNFYILFRDILGNGKLAIIYLGSFCAGIASGIGAISMGIDYGNLPMMIVLTTLMCIFFIPFFSLHIKFHYYLAKSFSMNGFFGIVAMILLIPGYMIIGQFGNYLGAYDPA